MMRTHLDAYTWNRLYPVGSAVEIRLANGNTITTKTKTKTKTSAYLWGGLSLVEVEDRAGPFTLDALRAPVTDKVKVTKA